MIHDAHPLINNPPWQSACLTLSPLDHLCFSCAWGGAQLCLYEDDEDVDQVPKRYLLPRELDSSRIHGVITSRDTSRLLNITSTLYQAPIFRTLLYDQPLLQSALHTCKPSYRPTGGGLPVSTAQY
jgi:hypothetical protein